MRTGTLVLLLALLLCSLGVAGAVSAMDSPGYRLDWFIAMGGSGGGPASSPAYTAGYTLGQSVIGDCSSANYRLSLGYWPGAIVEYSTYLPLIVRSS